MCHTYSESWVRALSHGPILVQFFFTKFSRRSKRSKKFPFLHFLRASPRNISSGRQSDNFDASRLPNTSFESYAPNFSGNMLKLVKILKFGVPPFCEVSLYGFRAPPNSCLRAFFLGIKLLLAAKPSTFDPIVLYIIGKLWMISFSWYFGEEKKHIFFILQSVRISGTHPDWSVTISLKPVLIWL